MVMPIRLHLVKGFWLWLLLATVQAQALTIEVVTEEYPPYNYTNNEGRVVGVVTEIVKELLSRAEFDYTIKSNSWARSYQQAQSQPNVLIYSIVRTPEREAMFKWIGTAMVAHDFVIRLTSRDDIVGNSLQALKQYSFGAVYQDVRAGYFREAGIQPRFAATEALNIKKLLTGRIDMLAIDQLSLLAICNKLELDPAIFFPVLALSGTGSDVSLAMSHSTSDEVVNRLKETLAAMQKDGTITRLIYGYSMQLPHNYNKGKEH